MKSLTIALLAVLALGACSTATEEKKTGPDTEPAKEEKNEPAKDESSASSMTPTETVKAFITAYEKVDVEAMKKLLSKKSLEMLERSGEGEGQSLDDRLKEFMKAEQLPFKGTPEMRNEKIDGDKATVEVKVDGKWEPTPLVKEDGAWKFSMME